MHDSAWCAFKIIQFTNVKTLRQFVSRNKLHFVAQVWSSILVIPSIVGLQYGFMSVNNEILFNIIVTYKSFLIMNDKKSENVSGGPLKMVSLTCL